MDSLPNSFKVKVPFNSCLLSTPLTVTLHLLIVCFMHLLSKQAGPNFMLEHPLAFFLDIQEGLKVIQLSHQNNSDFQGCIKKQLSLPQTKLQIASYYKIHILSLILHSLHSQTISFINILNPLPLLPSQKSLLLIHILP